jgi:hypothetical protein
MVNNAMRTDPRQPVAMKDKVEVSGDAFGMLRLDFVGSHHFYTRQHEHQRKKR